GELESAASQLLNAVYLQPTHIGLVKETVGALLSVERYADAEELTELVPHLAADLDAAVLAARGDTGPARERLIEAQQQDPSQSRAYTLAGLAVRAGDVTGAIDVLLSEAARHLPGRQQATAIVALAIAIRSVPDRVPELYQKVRADTT